MLAYNYYQRRLQFIVTAEVAAAAAATRIMEHETMDEWEADVSNSQLIAAAERYEGKPTCIKIFFKCSKMLYILMTFSAMP